MALVFRAKSMAGIFRILIVVQPAYNVRCREGEMRIRILLTLLLAMAHGARAQNDWPAYGRDPGAQRYSPLKQINPGNVDTLVQAWTVNPKPESGGKGTS